MNISKGQEPSPLLTISVLDPDPDSHGSALNLMGCTGYGSRWGEGKVKKGIVLKCWMFSFECCWVLL